MTGSLEAIPKFHVKVILVLEVLEMFTRYCSVFHNCNEQMVSNIDGKVCISTPHSNCVLGVRKKDYSCYRERREVRD